MKHTIFLLGTLVAALVAPAIGAPASAPDTLGQRAVEMHSGMLAEMFPAATPPELDKSVPLPAGGTLLGSVVLTPIQSYAEHGSPGTIELYYDVANPTEVGVFTSTLARAGWQARTSAQSTTVMCKAGAPALLLTAAPTLPAPYGNHLTLTVYRSRPGWTPCQ